MTLMWFSNPSPVLNRLIYHNLVLMDVVPLYAMSPVFLKPLCQKSLSDRKRSDRKHFLMISSPGGYLITCACQGGYALDCFLEVVKEFVPPGQEINIIPIKCNFQFYTLVFVWMKQWKKYTDPS